MEFVKSWRGAANWDSEFPTTGGVEKAVREVVKRFLHWLSWTRRLGPFGMLNVLWFSAPIPASWDQASRVTASLPCGQQQSSSGRRTWGFPSCKLISIAHPLPLPSPLSLRPCLLSMLLPPPTPGTGSGAPKRPAWTKRLGLMRRSLGRHWARECSSN